MAIVKTISCRGANPQKSIDYICNKQKTKSFFSESLKHETYYDLSNADYHNISHINCTPGDEAQDFAISQKLYAASKNYRVRSDNIHYIHVIQSFSLKDNITPEKAHELGMKLMKEHYGSHAQIVIATHADKGHIHNHFIVNSVSIAGKKFYDNKTTLTQLRNLSDKLCREYGLSVIQPKGRSKSYKEVHEIKKGNSWKEEIRIDIDRAILLSKDFNEFKNNLKSVGYEFKEPRKYLTMRKKGYDRFIRSKTLGSDYTEDFIKKRIANKTKLYIADFNNKGQPIPIPTFIESKRTEYQLINAIQALKYLNALEILYRLLVNSMFTDRKKWDLRKPYIVMNDYAVRKLLLALQQEEKTFRAKLSNKSLSSDFKMTDPKTR